MTALVPSMRLLLLQRKRNQALQSKRSMQVTTLVPSMHLVLRSSQVPQRRPMLRMILVPLMRLLLLLRSSQAL